MLTQTWTSGLPWIEEDSCGAGDFAGDVCGAGAGADGVCCARIVAGANSANHRTRSAISLLIRGSLDRENIGASLYFLNAEPERLALDGRRAQ